MREQYALVQTDPRGDEEADHGEGGEMVGFNYATQESPPLHAFSIDGGELEVEEEEEEDYIPIEEGAADGIFVIHSTNHDRVRKFTFPCCALLLIIIVVWCLDLQHKLPNNIVSGVKSFPFQHEEEDASSGESDGYYQPFEPPGIIDLEDMSSSEKANNKINQSKENGGGEPHQRLPTPASPSHPVEGTTKQPGKGAKKSQPGDDEFDDEEYDQNGDDDEVDTDHDTGEENTSNQGDDVVDDDPVPSTVDYDDDDVSNSPLPADNEASTKDKNTSKGQGKTNEDNHDTEDRKDEEPFDFTPTELLPPGDKSNGKNCRYTPGVAMEEDPFEIAKGDWPWYPLSTHESSPPPDDPACSCWNNTAACCERGIHPNHKFGHHLLEQLFGEQTKEKLAGKYYNFGGLVNETSANQAGGKIEFRYPPEYFHRPGNVDYREVFVWRNTYEAMVSGYLYHKAGYECWLTGYGKPYKETQTNKKPVQDSWMLNPAPHVPTEKREICQYLVDESEYDGMRVYVEFVVRRYYFTTINIYKAVQLYEDPRHRRTLFVCFEDLNSHVQATKEAVIRRIIAWMFPGGQHADAPPPEAVEYEGGHATDHEASQRERLYNIVKQLDDEVFGGALRNLNEMFGNCGGKL